MTAPARSIISRTAGSCSLDLGALVVAQRLHVQHAAPPRSRCCRTGCRGSRARSAGGRAARSPRRASRRRRARRAPARCSTLSHGRVELARAKRAARRPQQRMGRDQRAAAARRRGRAPSGAGGAVLDAQDTTTPRGRPRAAALEPRRAPPGSPNSNSPVAARPAAAPRRWRSPLGARKRTSRATSARRPRRRTAARGGRTRSSARGVGGRVDDPERRRRGVLGRARACTGRARSPRRAACRRAVRASLRRGPSRALAPEQLRHAGVERRQAAPAPSRAGARSSVSLVQRDPAASAGSSARSARARWPPAAGTRPSTPRARATSGGGRRRRGSGPCR